MRKHATLIRFCAFSLPLHWTCIQSCATSGKHNISDLSLKSDFSTECLDCKLQLTKSDLFVQTVVDSVIYIGRCSCYTRSLLAKT